MTALHEPRTAAAPERGRLRALVAASYVSSLGDGAFLAAAPLAAAAITRDPTAVAIVATAEYLPWLAITPFAGALVDRWPHRRVLVISDLARAAVLAAMAAAVFLGFASIPVLAVVAFIAVIGQIFADTASQAVVLQLAGPNDDALHHANGHISSANTTGKSLLGPPLGSLLYSLTPWVPFALDAVSFAGSGALMFKMPREKAQSRNADSIFLSMKQGAAFLIHNRQLRTLCLLIAAANLANFMAISTLVLFATEVLGVSNAVYGVLLAASAIGGVAGGLLAGRVARWLGSRAAIMAGLVIQVAVWPALAFSSNAVTAGALLATTEFCAAVATVVVITARQRETPPELLGRVVSAFRTVGAGAAPLGALAGGGLAALFGLHAPLIGAGVVLAAAVVLAARHIKN